MAAPIVDRDPGDEGDRPPIADFSVVTWRYEQLCDAGYPSDIALVLAENRNVDLHLARSLLKHGATIHEALRIVT